MGVGAGLYMYDVVVKKFTFAISSPDEFLSFYILQTLLMQVKCLDIYASTMPITEHYCKLCFPDITSPDIFTPTFSSPANSPFPPTQQRGCSEKSDEIFLRQTSCSPVRCRMPS